MNQFIRGVVRALTEAFDFAGPILEIGARRPEGNGDLADVRSFFADQDYQGLDLRPGPGVDCVASVEDLPHLDGSVGTVLALNTFEHVRRFWAGIEEVYRVLRPGGAFLLSCPFYFRVHRFPEDYWRFTPAALEVLLEKYPSAVLGWHGPRHRPAHVWALAFKDGRRVQTTEFDRYLSLLKRYAHEPGNRRRTWKSRLGRFLFGAGPFASYLDRNRWETVCRNPCPPSSLTFSPAAPSRIDETVSP